MREKIFNSFTNLWMNEWGFVMRLVKYNILINLLKYKSLVSWAQNRGGHSYLLNCTGMAKVLLNLLGYWLLWTMHCVRNMLQFSFLSNISIWHKLVHFSYHSLNHKFADLSLSSLYLKFAELSLSSLYLKYLSIIISLIFITTFFILNMFRLYNIIRHNLFIISITVEHFYAIAHIINDLVIEWNFNWSPRFLIKFLHTLSHLELSVFNFRMLTDNLYFHVLNLF